MKNLSLAVLASTALVAFVGNPAVAQFKERTIKLSAAVPQEHHVKGTIVRSVTAAYGHHPSALNGQV